MYLIEIITIYGDYEGSKYKLQIENSLLIGPTHGPFNTVFNI